ncbi:MAG: thiamine pyrophosphate-dependent dehydrogenase E1 component subunit alpha [Pseudomonadota bacterium]|nr:thiamine pyrophosphate-dependent dehydrogenase E1 component subunit alpha [Pseudomonadota bacterium]
MNGSVDPIELYEQLLYIRRVEERIASEYDKQEMRCPVHLSVGQEAVPVGVSACLKKRDHVVSAHRSHAHYLAKGGNLNSMLCELFGKADGCAGGKGGSMHLIDIDARVSAAVPIVGSSISIGVGIGFGLHLQGKDEKVVVYLGDGATEEGVFSESLDFAALYNLPVLFVCENNLYSVYTPIGARQAENRDLQRICDAHGIKAFAGDGNNVLEVYDLASEALGHMKKFNKPVLLEFSTYRWLEHCGPNWDDHLGYRPPNELEDWIEKCPIEQLRSKIEAQPNHDQRVLENIEKSITEKIQNGLSFARASKFPEPDNLFRNIYA